MFTLRRSHSKWVCCAFTAGRTRTHTHTKKEKYTDVELLCIVGIQRTQRHLPKCVKCARSFSLSPLHALFQYDSVIHSNPFCFSPVCCKSSNGRFCGCKSQRQFHWFRTIANYDSNSPIHSIPFQFSFQYFFPFLSISLQKFRLHCEEREHVWQKQVDCDYDRTKLRDLMRRK